MEAFVAQAAVLLNQALETQQGENLGALLNWERWPKSRKEALASQAANAGQVHARCRILGPFSQIVACHLVSLHASSQGDFSQAFKQAKEAANLFTDFMRNQNQTNWWVSTLNALCVNLRLTATKTAKSGKRGGSDLEATAEILNEYYRLMIQDRAPAQLSKKQGVLMIIVHLFQIYFRLNKLNLCKPLVTSVVKAGIPPVSSFPKSHRVTYNFFVGRLQVFSEEYEQAEEALDDAFSCCHKDAHANKRRILEFLIPVKLIRGKFPREALLRKYKLPQFDGITTAIRKGQVMEFNRDLEQYQEYFIRKGTFLMLEKLKTTVYRNLFRKVYTQYTQLEYKGTKNANHLKLVHLLAALRANGVEMDLDEIECILANLIYQQSIKGYIAHGNCVVLSKADPFPSNIPV
eukprot:gb/GEZN01009498.1/.p1 GENE.gb/GEZN01009498.1/~~gb/GEZN01009498.1/.p1  ORF type:complete len:405 (+),score=56.53 gb/GEZN01009498.1/:77-1291(+)